MRIHSCCSDFTDCYVHIRGLRSDSEILSSIFLKSPRSQTFSLILLIFDCEPSMFFFFFFYSSWYLAIEAIRSPN